MSSARLALAALLVLPACDGGRLIIPVDSADTAAVQPPGDQPDAVPAQGALRRLTAAQYARVLGDLFGEGLVMPSSLEPDQPIDGLVSIGSATTSVSAWGVEQYEDAAFLVAEQVMADPNRRDLWVPCTAADGDTACLEGMVADLGRRLWRRPLLEDEIDRTVAVAQAVAADSGDFELGATYGMAVLLQSPNFLYRKEWGTAEGAARSLDAYELASRLSFTLWDGAPDDALLLAAESGELDTEAGLADQVDRMLADERFRDGVHALFTDTWGLYELEDMDKDPSVFTHASPELGPAALEETLWGIDRLVIEEDADFRDIMTTRRTWLDPRLAALYAVPAPSPDGFAETTLPDDHTRRGLLGQASVVALHAHSGASSPTLRGVFVRQALLCQTVPPPPGDVDASIPEGDASAPTMRERLKSHQENPSCSGCHILLDDPGLGLENFDGIGRWRDTENGATIDASGVLDGAPFDDAWDMGAAIRNHDRFAPCLVQRAYGYSTGHDPVLDEAALLEWLSQGFAYEGHSYASMLRNLVTSRAFRTVGGEEEQ